MIKYKNTILGSGGGGSSSHTPEEAPNTLKSVSYARIIDLISAGEIRGLVAGMQSIELDGVPIMNSDGSYNFDNVNVETRNGTIQQDVLTIIDGAESTTDVNAELKYNAPLVREIDDANANYASVTLEVESLYDEDTSNGDINGTSVTLRVEYQSNGSDWLEVNSNQTQTAVSPSAASGYDSYIVYGTGTPAIINEWWDGVNEQTVAKNVLTQFDMQYKIGNSEWETFSSVQYSKDVQLEASLDGSGQGSSEVYQFRVIATALDDYDTAPSASITGAYGLANTSDITIDGKTMSPYQRDVSFKLDGNAPWKVRVTRITADATTSDLQNATYWTELGYTIQKKFTYPLSALVAISVDATQFSQVPTRAYDCYGKICQIPSNYDPDQRTYTGDWDGTLIMGWTDNPAWCTYDLLLDDINGLGNYLTADMMDKWKIYEIGQYCDELIPDGYGSVTPRYTCNLYLQDRDDAMNWLIKFAGIFNGMIYWGARGDALVQLSQDSPSDPVYDFSNANVTSDGFTYQGSSRNTRYNACYVTWNDPDNDYKQATEYVEYPEGITKENGKIYTTQIQAYGCTNRTQARNKGLWYCFTSYEQSEIVTFNTGMEAEGLPAPSEVINVFDEFRAGARMAGRVLSGSTTTKIMLDSNFTFEPGTDYEIEVFLSNGTMEKKTVTNNAQVSQNYAVPDTAFSATPAKNAIYAISTTSIEPQQFRVITAEDNDDGSYKLTCLAYNSTKYGYIEDGSPFVVPSTGDYNIVPGVIQTIDFKEVEYQPTQGGLAFKLLISWPQLKGSYIRGYVVSYLPPNSNNWITLPEVSSPAAEIDNVIYGSYTVSVAGISVLGVTGASKVESYAVNGMYTTPADLTNFNMIMKNEQAILTWDKSSDLIVTNGGHIHVRHSNAITGANWNNSIEMTIPLPGDSTQVTVPLVNGTYLVRPISAYGVWAENPSMMETNEAVIESYNVVETWTPFPAMSGDFEYCELGVNGQLIPVETNILDLIDNWSAIDNVAEMDIGETPTFAPLSVWTSSEYTDLGSLMTCRITATATYDTFQYGDEMDVWPDVDARSDWDGQVANCNLQIWVSCTDDDPADSSAVWRDWQKFFTGDWKARGFKFKIVLQCLGLGHGIEMTNLSVVFDMADRTLSGNNVNIASGGTEITFPNAFLDVPAIGITLLNATFGDSFNITDKTAAGFKVTIYDKSGATKSGVIDWIAKGYGSVPN